MSGKSMVFFTHLVWPQDISFVPLILVEQVSIALQWPYLYCLITIEAEFVELVTQELTCHRATKSFIQQFCLALSYFEGSLSKKQILVEIMDKGKISDSALRRIHLLDVREADFVCLDLEALLTSGRRQVMSFNHAQFFVDVMWTLACSGEDDFEYPGLITNSISPFWQKVLLVAPLFAGLSILKNCVREKRSLWF